MKKTMIYLAIPIIVLAVLCFSTYLKAKKDIKEKMGNNHKLELINIYFTTENIASIEFKVGYYYEVVWNLYPLNNNRVHITHEEIDNHYIEEELEESGEGF
ncbi:hypothetical protein [Candidatus Uabimicrobium sp. HlEnr_7]|uniref:hypothetical protein n=1 Tax=Candidatus Uabimicrobium helgolandensis TaxID=3095367 RepID=UPI00355927C9